MEKQIKIPKLHKTTNPKHREDYVFVEKPGEDFTALKLISGPFSSIVYKYGKVGFRLNLKRHLKVRCLWCLIILL